MPRRIHLAPYLTDDELQKRYRAAADPVERSHWHFLWLLAGGLTATAVAAVTGYSAYWIGQIARRYNTDGPEGVRDRRHSAQEPRLLLPPAQQGHLREALAGPHPEGDHWCCRTIAAWIADHVPDRTRRLVPRQTGWRYLRRLGARWCKPRPRHVGADPAAQAEFIAHLRPLLRAVATAFPYATVELWAVDEHRIGLKPILHKVWCWDGQRPLAPVQQRFAWRYLVGFVHPASGRTVFHLASSVNIPLFEVELAAVARQVGASPTKQIVLVLDRAGWHNSVRLRVPEHVHLLFPVLLACLLPRITAGRAPVAADEHRLGQSALREHRGVGKRPSGALRRSSRAPRSPPLHHVVPLVAPAHQETARSQENIASVLEPFA
jgi:transposase